MSLSKKIAEARDAELLATAASQIEADRVKKEDEKRRIEVVTHALIVVAESLEEECAPLGEGICLPKYFRFGDYIVMTQLFETVSELESPDKPTMVLAQYYAALVGIDKRTGGLETRRIGMVRWLDFDSLYKAITTAPSYLDFDPEKVKELINLK